MVLLLILMVQASADCARLIGWDNDVGVADAAFCSVHAAAGSPDVPVAEAEGGDD